MAIPIPAPSLPTTSLPPRKLLPLPSLNTTSRRALPLFSFPFPRFPRPNPKPPAPAPPSDDHSSIGDCLVFEEDAFEDPFLSPGSGAADAPPQDLVPEKWREAVAELKLSKKDKRRILLERQHGSRVLRRSQGSAPAVLRSPEYLAFRREKLSQLRPVVLDNPVKFPEAPPQSVEVDGSDGRASPVARVDPRSPRLEIKGESLESIREFFSSGDYVPGASKDDDKKPGGSKKLFNQEEKALLNKRVPDLAVATSKKWLPLHTIAASGEFYLMDSLLKYDVDINAVNADGLSAVHKAILGKKQAILNYLLRNSANPFVRDNDGATLMHYAVLTASTSAIKTLLLYNVDINLSDDDGWTPLHLAVQTQRTDIVKLLLIKGANKTIRNKDGLTPLGLCLYSGRTERTYEVIELLKKFPRVS